MNLSELPEYLQRMMLTGHTVTTVVWKDGVKVARLDFKLEESDKRDEVRIPCVIVPPSPFHKKP